MPQSDETAVLVPAVASRSSGLPLDLPVNNRLEIFNYTLPLLAELVPDWDFEDWESRISDDTLLIADLDLTSVEFIDLFVGIEKALGRTIGFHDLLMVDGRYISDLRLGELLDFVFERLQSVPDGTLAKPAAVETLSTHAMQASQIDQTTIQRFRAIIPQPHPQPTPAHRNPPALFVLSAPRSGSTLLQTILAGHPELFAPPELHLLWFRDLAERRLAFRHDANRHLTSGAIRAMMELDGLAVDEASALLEGYEARHMSVSDFYALMQQRLGSRLLVDKTPANAYSLSVLQRSEQLFEQPRYLHLVRHPGGMSRSFMDAHLERTVPFMQRHAAEFTSEQFAELAWLTCNQNILDFLDQVPGERQHRVGYEDLVSDPESTLRSVCEFLGRDFHPEMLDPYQDKSQRMADGLKRVGEMSGDLKFHLHEHIDPEAAYRWQRYLDEDALSTPTWALAETLGYRRGG